MYDSVKCYVVAKTTPHERASRRRMVAMSIVREALKNFMDAVENIDP